MYKYAYLSRQSPTHVINQDSVKTCLSEQNHLLVVVCDGVSGSKGGDIASETVTYRLAKEFKELLIPNDYDIEFLKQWFENSIEKAKQDLQIELSINQSLKDMATTVCVGIFVNNDFYCFNVGDSRAYLLTPTLKKQITIDQTLANFFKEKKLKMNDDLASSSESLVNFIGVNNNKRLSFDVFSLQLHKNEIVMLCSDGVYKFTDSNYEDLHSKNPEQGCNYIIGQTILNRSNDDATIALVYYYG